MRFDETAGREARCRPRAGGWPPPGEGAMSNPTHSCVTPGKLGRTFLLTLSDLAAIAAAAPVAEGAPIALGRTEVATDYVSFGLGGIGNGSGSIEVSGAHGPVRKAFLYWHGIDNSGEGAVYDHPRPI